MAKIYEKKIFYRNIYMLWVLVCLFISTVPLQANDKVALDSLVNLLNKHKNSPEMVKSILKDFYATTTKYISVDPEKSSQYADTMLKFATQIKDEASILRSRVLKSYTYIYLYKPDIAITQLEQLLPSIRKLNDPKLLTTTYILIGMGYNRVSKVDKALESYLNSLRVSEGNNELLKNTALTYYNIAQMFIGQGKINEALQYGLKAKKAYLTLKEYKDVAKSLAAIGACYLSTGKDNDSARIYLEQAVDMAKRHDAIVTMNMARGNLAILYYETQDFKKAIKISLEILQTSEQPATIATTYANLISCYMGIKDFTKAKKTAKDALDYLDKFNLPNIRAFIYSLMSEIYSSERNFESALEYYKIAKNLNDSLNNQNNIARLNELNIQYETTKKENEIAKLKTDQEYQAKIKSILITGIISLLLLLVIAIHLYLNNKKLVKTLSITNEKLQTANENLKIVNTEKNEFIGVVAHNLKNPIANMSIIAETVKSYSDKLPHSQLINMMDNIQCSSKSMMELISNLLDINAIEDGKINANLEEINLHTILMEIVDTNKPMATKKNIMMFLYMPEDQITINYDERIFREIIGNYISNAIKFSPFDKSIYISFNQLENGSFKIAVKDEGPGLSEDDKSKLFTKYTKLTARPTGGENSTGLGLSIVKKLAELMNSQVMCESILGEGAEFSLIIQTTNNTKQQN